MISSLAMPATGEPRMTRGTSPQASVVDRPTASSRRQISGTSSTRIQCSWMFWRSVRSAESAGEVDGDLADDAQLLGGERAAVDPHPQHEVLVLELVRLQRGGLAAVDPGLALGVQAPPAEAAVQVRAVDASRSRAWSRSDSIRSRTFRPLSSCFQVSLAFSGAVPSTFHWPCGLAAGGRGASGGRRQPGPGTLRLELSQSWIDG